MTQNNLKLLRVIILCLSLVFYLISTVSSQGIGTVSNLTDLVEIVDISWTNNTFSKIIPPGDVKYNNNLGVIAYADGFDTNFIASLIAVTNDTGTGTNFVLYPVKVMEITNGTDRARHYLSAISTNPVAIYTTEVSIVNYPEDWIEETYGEPPAWLSGNDLQQWYDDRDPIREYITFSLIGTNSVVDYEAWLTNTVSTYSGTNTNSVLSIYSNSIVFFETDASAADVEFYLHAPTNVSTLDLFKSETRHLASLGWHLFSSIEHNTDPILLSDMVDRQ